MKRNNGSKIFNHEKKVTEILEQLSSVPWFKSYLEQIPEEFINMFLASSKSKVEVSVKNDTVVETCLANPGGRINEYWRYYLAEPYPGIRITAGNITGLMTLESIGAGIPDTRTSVIHYCVKGRCEILTRDGRYAFMEPGVLCVESHKHKEKNFNFYGEEYECVEIAFDMTAFDEEKTAYLKSLGIDLDLMNENYDKDAEYFIGNVSPQLKNAEMELDSLMKGDAPDSLTLFLAILRINNMVKSGYVITDSSKFYLTKGQRKIVSEIHDYFINHIAEDITVEQITEKYSISHVSLNKYFKIMYGETIPKYMHNYRMEYAAKELIRSSKSIAEIAALVGYDNQSKFSGAFKKKYGMTPLEYRRSVS